MAKLVSLTMAKAQLRVTNNAEDDLINLYIDSAGAYIAKFCNYDSVDELPGMDVSPTEVPADIQEAALMLITSSWEQRGALVVGSIVADNPAVMNKLWPYRTNLGI